MAEKPFQCVVPGCPEQLEELTTYPGHNPVCPEHQGYSSDEVRCCHNGCGGKVEELRSNGQIHIPLCDDHSEDGKWVKWTLRGQGYDGSDSIRPVIAAK